MSFSGRLIICLFFIIFILATPVVAQNTDVSYSDSIKSTLPQLTGEDKLEAIYSLIKADRRSNIGKQYIDLMVEESRKQNAFKYEGLGLTLRVEWYYSQFETDSVFIAAKEAEAFCMKHGLDELYFKSKQVVIQRNLDQGMYSIALKAATEVYDEAKSTKQPPKITAITLASIANAYLELNQYKEALEYFNKSNNLLNKDSLNSLYSENYMHMSTACISLKDYKSANLYTDSLQYALNKERSVGRQVDIYYYFSEIYRVICSVELGELKLATKHLQLAEDLYDPDWGEMPSFYLKEAYVRYYNSVGNYKQASKYIDENLNFVTRNNLSFGITEWTLRKGVVLSEMNNYKDACDYFQKYIELSDSLKDESFIRQINELRTIYDLDKAEMQVEQHALTLQVKNNMIVGLVSICILLLIIGSIIYIYSQRLKRKNRVLYKRIQKQDKLGKEVEEKNIRINQSSENNEQIKNGKLFQALKELMEDEAIYTQTDIDRKSIAKRLTTNEKYLFDSVKEHTGLSFSEYISELRLNLAKKLLSENTSLTIEDIAIGSGFGSRATFHRQFKEKFDLSPAQYRKAALSEDE